MAKMRSKLSSREPGAEGGRPSIKGEGSHYRYTSSRRLTNGIHPKYPVHNFEYHAVVANAEAIFMRAGEPFRELQRIIVRCIETHFVSDALSVWSG